MGPDLAGDAAWANGHYELMVDAGTPERAGSVIEAMWSHPGLHGDVTGEEWRRRGAATAPDGTRVACGTYGMNSRPDFLPDGEPYPPDLVVLYLPLASLSWVWPGIGAYPFEGGQDTRPWQEPLEDWLAGIASFVHGVVPFPRAVSDFESDLNYGLWRSWDAENMPERRRWDLMLDVGGGLRRFRRNVWV